MSEKGAPLATGHLLDSRYRIEKVIGVGGMGRVYRANDTRLANRPVAIKEMLVGEGLQEKKAVEDFAREARVLAPLSHPGIPNLIDYFAEGGRHYLVMEYIAGRDLQSWLDARGSKARVPESQVLRWARAILEVLRFLHSQIPPIVYRDLKPGNIMLDRNGRAMLIDFGIARFLPAGGRGTQIGSVGYAPPEQYLGKMEPRSDLYSLAATMHHLLTGRDPQLEPPFSFPPVRALAPEVSPPTEATITKALERDPDKRPNGAGDMLLMLPEPGEDADSPAIEAPTSNSGSLARLRTIVLSRIAPIVPGHSAAPSELRTTAPAAADTDPDTSPTAKTADLKFKSAAISKPPPRPAHVPLPVTPSEPAAPAAGSARRPPAPAPRTPAASLICKSESRRFVILGSRTVIGRHGGPADSVDIDLGILRTGGDRVSRRHAEIIKRGAEYFIRDLGSLNGTFIVGLGRLGRDQLYKLNDHDQVAFAGATFEFQKGDAT